MKPFELAKMGLKDIFEAVPKGKFRLVFMQAQNLEGCMNAMAALLKNMRQYFLDTTGEESPFVKKIDELIPRD